MKTNSDNRMIVKFEAGRAIDISKFTEFEIREAQKGQISGYAIFAKNEKETMKRMSPMTNDFSQISLLFEKIMKAYSLGATYLDAEEELAAQVEKSTKEIEEDNELSLE